MDSKPIINRRIISLIENRKVGDLMKNILANNLATSGPSSQKMFGKIAVAPAYRVVFDKIETLIMSGRLKPGDILPTETELAEQFDINRSTLREGIRLLEQNGLVVRGSAKRLTVSVPHIVDLTSRISSALLLHDVTFQELWESYIILEPALAKLAAANATQEMIKKLEDNLEAMIACGEDADRFNQLDYEFHDLVAEAANNRPMLIARQPISILMMPAAHAILPRLHTYDRVIVAHGNIISAIRAHDQNEAWEWMHKHSTDFKRGYEEIGFDAGEHLVDFGIETSETLNPLISL